MAALIYQLPQQLPGSVGVYPTKKYMTTGDNLATITAAGYLNQVNLESNPVTTNDILSVLYSYNPVTQVGTFEEFAVSISNGVITLTALSNAGEVTLPTIANHIATYTNTAGHLSEDPATAISGGNIQAGTAAIAGALISTPGTANGNLQLKAVASAGNFAGIISNASLGQATTWSLADPGGATANIVEAPAALVNGNLISASGTAGLVQDAGIAANKVQTSALTNPDNISDLVWFDVTCSAAALATAGKVNVVVSSGSKQYKVRNVIMNYSASGLSGGGGDRLLALTDGTTVYNNAGITAALLGTPINTVWGGTGNPLAGTVAQNTSTVAAANLYFQYSGGTTDYTTGSVVISVLVQRVA